MDAAHDIPDSTDWLETPLKGLSSLENALHCQICKEFFDTPMITSCSHTFCSKCIRTALSTDGCCPACRSQDQASKLRNNWQLQEVVATFQAARPETIRVARAQQHTSRPRKRKRAHPDAEAGQTEESSGRTTRSKSRKVSSQTSQPEAIELDDTEDESFVEAPMLDDGLVECPLGCGQRMKIEQVEPHLDRCEDERKAREQTAQRVKKPPIAARPQDRLNELNYSMMKENNLARKMKDLGIPAFGSKQLMIRRHTAWVNIWNANCDSSNPRNKRELLRELDTWERTQGGSVPNPPSGIMRKDFDGPGWMKKNESDFSRLIADARRTKSKAAELKKDEEAVDNLSKAVVHELAIEDGMEDESISSSHIAAGPQELKVHAPEQSDTVSLPGKEEDAENYTASTEVPTNHADQDLTVENNTGEPTPTKKKMPMFTLPSESVEGVT